MELTDPLENQYSRAGDVPKLESIYGIALYEPEDGKIVHMHLILNLEGAEPIDPQKKEKEVLEGAKNELNRDISKLYVLHDSNLQDISANYYVNVKEKKLVKIPDSEIQKKLKKPQE